MKAIPAAVLALAFTFLTWLPLSSPAQNPSIPSPQASTPSGEVDSNPAFWQAKFDNGGHYLVKLGAISSASKHEYVANAAARVVEVTISASGAVVARFYYLEALGKESPISGVTSVLGKAQSLAQNSANNASPGSGNIKVVKDYPNTTHAHTVEYALQSEVALNSLYQSLLKAIDNNRGRTWTETSK